MKRSDFYMAFAIMRKAAAVVFVIAAACIAAACSQGGGAPELIFSDLPGIYQSRFELFVGCSDQSLTLYYTTDCSNPTPDSNLYDSGEGISLAYRGGGRSDPSSVNIIRVAAFDSDGNQVGETLTGTYILSDVPEVRYTTMIVSIVCEPDDLYDYERGIMVEGKVRDEFLANRPAYWPEGNPQLANFFMSGREWERPAHVEFFSETGEPLLTQEVGIRVSGGYNRQNEVKSLRLFARYDYADKNVMSYDFYPGLGSLTGVPVGDFKSLILRSGSNNIWNSMVQTQFLMQLGEDVGLDTMHYRPVCVYLNGKYYGYMAMVEDYSPTYFETHYNLDADNITCINGAAELWGERVWELDNGETSEFNEFKHMMNYIMTLDMRSEEYYQKASEMLDLDNFIRYMCFEGYIANSDWPQNNVRVWRYNNGETEREDKYNPDAEAYGEDGRWRFLLKDLDLAAGYGDAVETNIFSRLDSDDGGLRLNAVFKSLFRNADFRNRVFCFMCDLISDTMKPENVGAALGEVAASALGEMRYFTKSYGVSGGSNEAWQNHLSTPMSFFERRYDIVKEQLADEYDSVWANLSVKVDGEGRVGVNTLNVDSGAELSYLVGLRVPVTATPADGWKLKSLTVDGKPVELEEVDGELCGKFMVASRNPELEVVFEPDSDYIEPTVGLVINELKYNHPRIGDYTDLVEIYNGTDAPVYLKGYTLVKEGKRSDGSDDRDEWVFPAATLGAGEYMVIACDNIGTKKLQVDYHASFALGVGDKLTLYDRYGNEVDSLKLPECNNFVVLARDELGEWYFEPDGSFGEPNIESGGYELTSVIDSNAFGKFIHDGRFIDDLAVSDGDGSYTISLMSLREHFGSDRVERHMELLESARVSGGYDLDEALAVLDYHRFYIETLDSNILFRY